MPLRTLCQLEVEHPLDEKPMGMASIQGWGRIACFSGSCGLQPCSLPVLIQPMSRSGSLTLPATRSRCSLVSLQTRRPAGDLLMHSSSQVQDRAYVRGACLFLH